MALPFKRHAPPPKNRQPINQNIRHRMVMLIGSDGNKIGDTPTLEAIALAQKEELDLVLINERAIVPVAKIMDYGKYLYEQKRKIRESKRKTSTVKVKSISVKPQISDHDLTWKSGQAIEWLNDGDRVHFVIKAYGRIRTKTDLIMETFNKFVKLVESAGVLQAPLKKQSDVLYEAFFIPNKGLQTKKE